MCLCYTQKRFYAKPALLLNLRRAQDGRLKVGYSVCVMGLGTVGFPTATYLKDAGCEVTGYDISPYAIGRARPHIPVCDIDRIPLDTEIFVICVSTTRLNDKPIASNVYDACTKISRRFHPRLIVIESTVPIGTCRDIYRSILKGRVNLAHVPHRYWPEDPHRHGVSQSRVAGGVNAESFFETRSFYDEIDVPLVEVEPIEIAEMSKIAENAYRYVQIAFAEELRSICERNSINFNTLRKACNTKWNIAIPEARDGIGGTCLPKDIRYLIDAARSKGFEPEILLSAIHADEKYVDQLLKTVCYT